MEFKLKDYHYNTTDQELIDDLKIVAAKCGRDNITSREYDDHGKFTSGTIHRRLGNWNNALIKAGLTILSNKNISDKELFENLEKVWIGLGQQPTDRQMRQPLSNFSKNPYLNRFGTWRKALHAFIEFINSDKELEAENLIKQENAEPIKEKEITFKHKTKRYPSERLKVQVLMRDGNKCRLCGITVTGNNIHFDHILAWSKGGETTLENLQVLCETHNLAKGSIGYNDL